MAKDDRRPGVEEEDTGGDGDDDAAAAAHLYDFSICARVRSNGNNCVV